MSPEERIRRLCAEARLELDRLDRVARELSAAMRALSSESPSAARMAVAGYLHSFYTGCESILVLVARALGDLPQGESWHQALLVAATAPLEGVRPPVVSPETANRLLDFLRFRHFFRASYGVQLEVPKLSRLGAHVEETRAGFRTDVESLLTALESAD